MLQIASPRLRDLPAFTVAGGRSFKSLLSILHRLLRRRWESPKPSLNTSAQEGISGVSNLIIAHEYESKSDLRRTTAREGRVKRAIHLCIKGRPPRIMKHLLSVTIGPCKRGGGRFIRDADTPFRVREARRRGGSHMCVRCVECVGGGNGGDGYTAEQATCFD